MHHPDGMATMAHELEAMRQAKNAPEPAFDVVACDEDDTRLYVAESEFTERQAQRSCRRANQQLPRDDLPDAVHHFEVRRRD